MRPEKKDPAVSKAVLHARVFSREQVEGYSIDAQLKMLRDYVFDRLALGKKRAAASMVGGGGKSPFWKNGGAKWI
jgi:hypothetical protein